MAKYKVKNTSILHNGTLYKEGSIIELDEKYAARLADFIEYLSNQSNSKTQNKTQIAKTKSQTKTETSDTSKDETVDGKDEEQDGGVNNDK